MEHLFGDVMDIQNGQGFCFVCDKVHACNAQAFKIDILEAGTSCKDLSMLNAKRKDFAGSYSGTADGEQVQEADGTSAVTYRYGFKKARLLIKENLSTCINIYIYIHIYSFKYWY